MDINIRLEQLQEAEDNYFITSKHLLDLTSRAYELFIGSEVEEKRQLMKIVLSNLRIEGDKLLWELNPPFDLILKSSNHLLWLEELVTLRTFNWKDIAQSLQLIDRFASNNSCLV